MSDQKISVPCVWVKRKRGLVPCPSFGIVASGSSSTTIRMWLSTVKGLEFVFP